MMAREKNGENAEIFISPGFKSAAAKAGWDEEDLVIARRHNCKTLIPIFAVLGVSLELERVKQMNKGRKNLKQAASEQDFTLRSSLSEVPIKLR